MSSTRLKINGDAIQAYLDGENGVRELLTAKAQAVLAAAQADAQNYVVTGNYLAGLEISEDHTDRLAVRVKGTSPHSHLVEAAHGTLARALDAAR